MESESQKSENVQSDTDLNIFWDKVRHLGSEFLEIIGRCRKFGMVLPQFCKDFYQNKISYKEFCVLAKGFTALLNNQSGTNLLRDEEFWAGRKEKIIELKNFCESGKLEYPQFIVAFLLGFLTYEEYELLTRKFISKHVN